MPSYANYKALCSSCGWVGTHDDCEAPRYGTVVCPQCQFGVCYMQAKALYALKEQLSKVLVFGPWTKEGDDRFVRPESGRQPSVVIHHCRRREYYSLLGWYYCIDHQEGGDCWWDHEMVYQTAEACMAAADACLADETNVFLVPTGGE